MTRILQWCVWWLRSKSLLTSNYKKLGLEKTVFLCQAADELKRYMARLKEAKTKLTSALLRSLMEEKAHGWVNAEAFPAATGADLDTSAAVLAKVKGAPG